MASLQAATRRTTRHERTPRALLVPIDTATAHTYRCTPNGMSSCCVTSQTPTRSTVPCLHTVSQAVPTGRSRGPLNPFPLSNHNAGRLTRTISAAKCCLHIHKACSVSIRVLFHVEQVQDPWNTLPPMFHVKHRLPGKHYYFNALSPQAIAWFEFP